MATTVVHLAMPYLIRSRLPRHSSPNLPFSTSRLFGYEWMRGDAEPKCATAGCATLSATDKALEAADCGEDKKTVTHACFLALFSRILVWQ